METPQTSGSTRAGMIGGLLFVFIGLSMEEVAKTAALAAIGATVSFLVTLICKWIIRKWKTR
jgi:hypothetical protein